MNRFVLALLALLAGLVAPVAPAQARMGGAGSAEVGAIESLDLTCRACAVVAVPGSSPALLVDSRGKTAGKARAPRPRVYIPTVYFGADRAFE
ncbi:MAG: hypothetical protein JSR96_03190 [Proteobacteria bacterium]|nr:hypothetical protein [Pseudomonadota bacterium]